MVMPMHTHTNAEVQRPECKQSNGQVGVYDCFIFPANIGVASYGARAPPRLTTMHFVLSPV